MLAARDWVTCGCSFTSIPAAASSLAQKKEQPRGESCLAGTEKVQVPLWTPFVGVYAS